MTEIFSPAASWHPNKVDLHNQFFCKAKFQMVEDRAGLLPTSPHDGIATVLTDSAYIVAAMEKKLRYMYERSNLPCKKNKH